VVAVAGAKYRDASGWVALGPVQSDGLTGTLWFDVGKCCLRRLSIQLYAKHWHALELTLCGLATHTSCDGFMPERCILADPHRQVHCPVLTWLSSSTAAASRVRR